MIKDYIRRYVRQKDGSLNLEWIYKPDIDYGESQTDKSNYKPNVPLYSQIDFNKGIPNNLVYDFPDGKDTGLDLTPLRNKSLDITEIQDIKNALEKSVNKTKKAIEAEVQNILDEQSKNSEQNNASGSGDSPNGTS